MKSRRRFMKTVLGFISGTAVVLSPLRTVVRFVMAGAKKIILPKGTDRSTLVDKNPAELDTRNLQLTPIQEFSTMGITDHQVNIDEWRLKVTGHVQTPLSLSYDEILTLPTIEKNVLLICPGFFANHGQWRGVSITTLLKMSGAKKAAYITVKGPTGFYTKTQRFPIQDIYNEKVFLAHHVNCHPLPIEHGFPLRVVAEDYYGYDWIKFVYQITVDRL